MTQPDNLSLLDPKNDFVFKKLFAQAPDLLAELINAVREDQPPVTVIEVLNPTIDPQELTGKCIVLDVLAQDGDGQRYNIEMQVRRYDAWSARSAYYLARMLTQQLDSGEDYRKIRPVIGIHLLNFNLFQQPEQRNQAVWCFEMRDRDQPGVLLGNELQLNLIELPKADSLGLVSSRLAAWVLFFEHWQEESTMANIAYTPVQQALQRVRDLSADDETRRQAFVRERALHDEVTLLREATERGLKKGKAESLKRLLNRKFGPLPDTCDAQINTASAEQLDQWLENLLFADELDAVFAT